MLRDERFWEDPSEFKPERFLGELKEGQVDPLSLIFGYGRRLAIQLPGLCGSGLIKRTGFALGGISQTKLLQPLL